MKIENFLLDDLDSLNDLQPEGWPDIRESFALYLKYDFCFPFKLTEDGIIAGLGAALIFKESAWLAHIIVRSDFRNRGLGLFIVESLMDEIRQRGIPSVSLIATAMGEPVYRRAGFRAVENYLFYGKKQKTCLEIPSASSEKTDLLCYHPNIQLFKPEFFNDVLRFDRRISGENREDLLRLYIDKAVLFFEKKEITGIYWPGMWEGPIYATDSTAGEELLRLKCILSEKVTIPAGNTAAVRFLEENGFIRLKTTAMRMIWGREIPWRPEFFFSRISGNFG